MNSLRFDDLARTKRVGNPVVSPDGSLVVFTLKSVNMKENRNEVHLHAFKEGEGVMQLTRQGTANSNPQFSPSGDRLAFTSNRSGESQIWILPLDGGEAFQATKTPLGARQPVWMPDGKGFLAATTVYKELWDLKEVAKRAASEKDDKPTHHLVDELLFRHWDEWNDETLEHLFLFDIAGGEGKNLTPGPYPVPPRALAGDPDYAVSPDGKEIAFVCLRDPHQAVSTNLNIWTVSPNGGEPKRVSQWAGAHAQPVYSPDGQHLAFWGMRRAGYEADRQELILWDREAGELKEVCPGFDRSVEAVVWSVDSHTLYFHAYDEGSVRVFSVPASGGDPRALTENATDGTPALSPDGATAYFTRETFTYAPELVRMSLSGGGAEPEQLTHVNQEVLGGISMDPGEEFWFEGAAGARVHGFLVKPPQFEAGKKYPVVFIIHGGPQGMFSRDFHERWNAQMFASPGYVAVLIDPRGSVGYGQEFTDAINGEWGGNCYEDLIRGFDYVLDTYDYCDRERTCAIGASFGGFMVNWMATQTNRFKCFVSHDGIFNTEMMNWATDELWFTEWEFNGLPSEARESYLQYSPHRLVHQIETPMLVIQGELDYRCTTGEGLGLFTALRRHGVEARLLYFPDEGHWVLKPKNRKVWYKTVLDWIEKHI